MGSVTALPSILDELGAALDARRGSAPRAGAAPSADVPKPPSETELEASLPDVDAALRRRRRVATQAVSSVVVVLPRDPRARVAADRLVADLRAVLGPQAVTVRAADEGDAGAPAGSAVVDLRELSGEQPLGRFALPTGASEAWTVTSDAAGDAVRVRVRSGGLAGAQLAINALREVAGFRALSYNLAVTPAGSTVQLPAAGTTLADEPSDRFRYRGMAPHTYHPIELSQALHDPSPRAAQVLRAYIDWCVATGQNAVHFPLLDVEADNVAVKLLARPERRRAWEAHLREMIEYAHARGVQVVANASFTVFTAAHLRAMGFVGATIDTFRLNGRQHDWMSAPVGSERRAKLKASYDRLLAAVTARHEQRIAPFVARLEQLGFDELHLNLGTSEFTAPNDDLQLAWIEMARRAAGASGDGMRVTVGSHVPAEPTSPRYGLPMFDLHLRADAQVGAHIHTVQIPALEDRADTYGVSTFRHKLRTLDAATEDRLETWYPETSYWVQYDVTVPLFLPVYMLARHRDHRRLLANDRLDGQLTFTTAWEWGYWLNDAAMARMTTHPTDDLTTILLDLLEPLGTQRDDTVRLLRDVMRTQQRYLVDDGLIRHLQGFDALSSLGETLGKVPLLNKVIHASGNVPQRVGWAHVRRYDAAQLRELETGDVARLAQLAELQERELVRARALAMRAAPGAAATILRELLDGLEVNLLRTRQVHAALTGMIAARRAQLGDRRDGVLQAALASVEQARQAAEQVIRRREAAYLEPAEDAYAGHRLTSGAVGTMWGKRSLTPVHTLKYWDATLEELRRAARSVQRR